MVQSPGEFAQQLRALREAQGLSMRALAGLIGVSSVTVWKWEKGDSKPRARLIAPLARVLDVPPRQLQFSAKAGGNPGALGPGALGDAGLRAAGVVPTGDGADIAMPDDGATPVPGEALAEVIARAKQMIAEASGTGSNNITIRIEY